MNIIIIYYFYFCYYFSKIIYNLKVINSFLLEPIMNQDITILIIDDDSLMQKVIEASLLKDNYKLLFASDGPSGIKSAREHMPYLILLDIVMPGIISEFVTECEKDDTFIVYANYHNNRAR